VGETVPHFRDKAELLAGVARHFGIPGDEILRPSHGRGAARARAVFCYCCKESGGVSGVELRKELKVSQSGISRLIAKGSRLVKELQLVI
jgi:chromosomal replication initiation ATPase DnaA